MKTHNYMRIVLTEGIDSVFVTVLDNASKFNTIAHLEWKYTKDDCKELIRKFYKTEIGLQFEPILRTDINKQELFNLLEAFALVNEIELITLRIPL